MCLGGDPIDAGTQLIFLVAQRTHDKHGAQVLLSNRVAQGQFSWSTHWAGNENITCINDWRFLSQSASSPPKSAKKGRKRVKATRNVKLKVFVESEDEEDLIVQPISSAVPALNLPQPSTIIVGTPHSPRLPCSLKKQLFGPASLIASSPPKVMVSHHSLSGPPAYAYPLSGHLWQSSGGRQDPPGNI
ncbi:hypothetical protein BDR07DRAFT_1487462 [Suillus spraguei]|nr:hypothetical protein BDR07DRAFT_1487462 [Suillus spraguei]